MLGTHIFCSLHVYTYMHIYFYMYITDTSHKLLKAEQIHQEVELIQENSFPSFALVPFVYDEE